MVLFLQPIQSNFGKQKCLWYTNFETLSSDAPYHKFYEDKSSENIIRRLELASGNPGFELTKNGKNAGRLSYSTSKRRS
mgnify:CR=1 FL=1